MAATRTLLTRTLLTSGRSLPMLPFPSDEPTLYLRVDDGQFTDPASRIRVTVEATWDGGLTFPWSDVTEWQGGAKCRDGSPPYVRLGPFKPSPPTHVRLSLTMAAGATVRVGLLGNI